MNEKMISIIVIAYDMPDQLANTLFALSSSYQKNCSDQDFEVIVVENSSENILNSDLVGQLPDNFHYHLRQEDSSSPAAAINFGLDQARGRLVGLMIDGAFLLTPGVISLAKDAWTISENAFVTVPSYHLGPAEQHVSSKQGYDVSSQNKLLQESGWKDDGYQLFTIAAWCGANPRGYFAPIMESNCYFATRQAFEKIGGADLSFQQPGGGAINLHITRKLGLLPGITYFSLAGEGAFHQYHGGITSNRSRSDYEGHFNQELQQHWGSDYRFLERNPIMLGSIKPQALGNMVFSAEKMLKRFDNCRANGWDVWADDKVVESSAQ